MNVLMISGSYPPEACGVGDYTAKLVESLSQLGITVKTLKGVRWNLKSMGRIRETIAQHQCDVVHIQYPSVGYGRSLVPQLLSFTVPAVVTLHEFSHVRIPRRLACVPFLFSARHLLFTSQFELDKVKRIFPWIARKSTVIPIGTSIIPVQGTKPRNFDEVIYFGLIAPRKGIEQVLELASAIKHEHAGIGVRLIGRVPDVFRDYARTMMSKAKDLPVTWILEESESEVAERLARASLAYLPFPDGASERRSSLKAALSSGVVCITTEGKEAPEPLRKVLVFATDSRDALAKVKEFLTNRQSWNLLSTESMAYSATYRWDHIAHSHLNVYERLCGEVGS
jgi:glycosyltransferase involved in cell wall biosynthesis